jgi:hypothetical protein
MRINSGKWNIKSNPINAQQPDGKQELGSQLGYFEDVQNGPKQNDLAAKHARRGIGNLHTALIPAKSRQTIYFNRRKPGKPNHRPEKSHFFGLSGLFFGFRVTRTKATGLGIDLIFVAIELQCLGTATGIGDFLFRLLAEFTRYHMQFTSQLPITKNFHRQLFITNQMR